MLKNLPLIIGLLSTMILSLYCVEFCREPILKRVNQPVVKVIQKPIKHQIMRKSQATLVVKKIAPPKEKKEESELDILAKKILENMNKNKDN